jgi:phage gp36-like protein
MSYISEQDLIDELGEAALVQLTDDAGTETINPAVVAKAIDAATGTFEWYARTRYGLPVPATPLVKSLCIDLAVYNLYRKRATFKEGVFEVKKTAYDEAIAKLKDLAAGRAALDVPASEETVETPASADKILTNAARSKFNDKILSGF